MIDASILGSNIIRVKTHNIRAVLLSLLLEETTYRVKIARQTSLSTTTITNIIGELIDMGIVAEDGVEEPEEPLRVGRPRAALRLVKDARYAIGVQISVERYRIVITNLRAEILDSRSHTFDRSTPPEQVFQQISEQTNNLILESGLERQRVLGVGVGAAGLVNYHNGVNILSANLGWENVPIRDWLADRLNLPVEVDNNVKAMALGEAFFGPGRDVGSLVFVYGRTGVGSGIVIQNHLLRGADLGAGEIGHMILIADGGEQCRCGQRGCLETLVSEAALIRQADALAADQPDSLLAQYWQAGKIPSIDPIFKAAREGDPAAREIVEHAAHYLGLALANLVNLLNPEMIVLGGLFDQGKDLILPIARQTLQQSAFANLGKKVKLQATHFGSQAGMIGAASLALTSFFYLNPEEL
jgi:glucokinase-like ROK family protein